MDSDGWTRTIFREVVNPLMLLQWRLGVGSFLNRRWPAGQVMVLTHTGRRSGTRYRTPVNYARHEGAVYACADGGPESHWYRNVERDPNVELWLPSERLAGPVEWWQATASPCTDPGEATQRLREVLTASGPAGLVAGFRPGLSDSDLLTWLDRYPVVRFDLGCARTGDGGPGDLAAAWLPLAILAVTVAAARRRR